MRVYDRYRDEGMRLNSRLLASRFFTKGAMDRIGAAAGIEGGPKKMLFDSEMEFHATMDAALCDVRGDGGRTAVQAYMEEVGPAGEFERAMLEARINARTSLYRVEARDAAGCAVRMSDLLHGGGSVTILDRGLSATLREGCGIFFRLYRLPELCMTSGVSFVFPWGGVPALVRRYRRMRKEPGRRGPVSRFALFFRMNRRRGLSVLTADEMPRAGAG